MNEKIKYIDLYVDTSEHSKRVLGKAYTTYTKNTESALDVLYLHLRKHVEHYPYFFGLNDVEELRKEILFLFGSIERFCEYFYFDEKELMHAFALPEQYKKSFFKVRDHVYFYKRAISQVKKENLNLLQK